jgi:hypothetical protein
MEIPKDELDTGDILLFHHTNDCKSCYNCFFSCVTGLIECCTESQFSHVAIIIRDPQFTNPPLKGLYVMESSFESFPDAEDHKYKFGVELEEFDKVIASAQPHERIYWRKLRCIRDRNFYQLLKEAHQEVHDKPYDFYPEDFINALIHKQGGDDGQLTSRFFCSALVAFLYVQWGFLPYTTQWSRVTPKMFSSKNSGSEPYKLVFKNCRVNPEIPF